MILYKCDKCGKLIENRKGLCQIVISLYNSENDTKRDICEECAYDYIKDFGKEKK